MVGWTFSITFLLYWTLFLLLFMWGLPYAGSFSRLFPMLTFFLLLFMMAAMVRFSFASFNRWLVMRTFSFWFSLYFFYFFFFFCIPLWSMHFTFSLWPLMAFAMFWSFIFFCWFFSWDFLFRWFPFRWFPLWGFFWMMTLLLGLWFLFYFLPLDFLKICLNVLLVSADTHLSFYFRLFLFHRLNLSAIAILLIQ